jgi:uncharacterized protein YbaP (TraB family)
MTIRPVNGEIIAIRNNAKSEKRISLISFVSRFDSNLIGMIKTSHFKTGETMKRLFRKVLAGVCLFYASHSYAQDAFLWKIDAPAGAVYLLGSIHAANKDFYPLPKIVEDAFQKSANLAVEVDITRQETAEQALEMFADSAFYPDGDLLQKHISRESLHAVLKEFDIYGANPYRLQKLRPWALAMLLSSLELFKSSADAQMGIDLYFLKRAPMLHKQILQLENMELQAKLFDGLSDQEQEYYLMSTIRGIKDEVKVMDRMMDIWRSGDVIALEKQVQETWGSGQLPQLNARMLTERNKNMVLKIIDLIKEQGVDFVVVGAAHMVGKDGIVQLLRSKGYDVARQ